jgi:hypothetical protein
MFFSLHEQLCVVVSMCQADLHLIPIGNLLRYFGQRVNHFVDPQSFSVELNHEASAEIVERISANFPLNLWTHEPLRRTFWVEPFPALVVS